MKMGDYFGTKKGTGVLATADAKGVVGIAIYASPHVIDDETVAFIMADKLTHQNLQSNPHAAYLFIEGDGKYKGKRLFLTKTKEEKDSATLESLRRKKYPDLKGKEYLVYFKIDKVLPLIGAGAKS